MKNNPPREVTVNTDEALYVIPAGDGYSCLGFQVADRKARAVAAWITNTKPETVTLTAEPGTLEHYRQYEAIMAAGAKHNRETGERCPADLTPALIGLEGSRVEVTAPGGSKSRFYVGKSTGWFPIHLEIKRSDSHGGGPVYLPEGAAVRVIRGSRR